MTKPPVRPATAKPTPPLAGPARLSVEEARSLKLRQIAGKAAKYLSASDAIKPLEKEKKELSGELKEAAVNLGETTGNTATLEVGGFKIQSITPVSKQLDTEEAIKVLKELNLLERCTTRVVDEKAIEIAFQEGLLDFEQIKSFTKEVMGTPRVSVTRA